MPPRIGILSFPDETSDYLIQKMPTYRTLHVLPFYIRHKYINLKNNININIKIPAGEKGFLSSLICPGWL